MRATRNKGQNSQLQHEGDGNYKIFLIKVLVIGIISLALQYMFNL